MLGKPKYKENEVVNFKIDDAELEGKIYIIDAFGTFGQWEEVSYDIWVDNSPLLGGEPCLYKHIIEPNVYKKS